MNARLNPEQREALTNLVRRAIEASDSGEHESDIANDFASEFEMNQLPRLLTEVDVPDLIFCAWCDAPAMGWANQYAHESHPSCGAEGHGDYFVADRELFNEWLVRHDAEVRASMRTAGPAAALEGVEELRQLIEESNSVQYGALSTGTVRRSVDLIEQGLRLPGRTAMAALIKASVDDKGIRGRLFEEDFGYLAGVVCDAMGITEENDEARAALTLHVQFEKDGYLLAAATDPSLLDVKDTDTVTTQHILIEVQSAR